MYILHILHVSKYKCIFYTCITSVEHLYYNSPFRVCVCVCVSVCSPPVQAQHVTGRLFFEREVVTLYHALSTRYNVVVFINAAKVDAGCARVVKLLQAWRHVNKRFSLYKQPKYLCNIELQHTPRRA